jgi:hypothetical protein
VIDILQPSKDKLKWAPYYVDDITARFIHNDLYLLGYLHNFFYAEDQKESYIYQACQDKWEELCSNTKKDPAQYNWQKHTGIYSLEPPKLDVPAPLPEEVEAARDEWFDMIVQLTGSMLNLKVEKDSRE